RASPNELPGNDVEALEPDDTPIDLDEPAPGDAVVDWYVTRSHGVRKSSEERDALHRPLTAIGCDADAARPRDRLGADETGMFGAGFRRRQPEALRVERVQPRLEIDRLLGPRTAHFVGREPGRARVEVSSTALHGSDEHASATHDGGRRQMVLL